MFDIKKFFVNHTNHPSARWSREQTVAAQTYGEIVDVPFPSVSPQSTSEEIRELVQSNAEKILAIKPAAVLCQGEFNYTFAMVERLKNFGVTVVAATTERVSHEEILPDGTTRQVSTFNFVQFREY